MAESIPSHTESESRAHNSQVEKTLIVNPHVLFERAKHLTSEADELLTNTTLSPRNRDSIVQARNLYLQAMGLRVQGILVQKDSFR